MTHPALGLTLLLCMPVLLAIDMPPAPTSAPAEHAAPADVTAELEALPADRRTHDDHRRLAEAYLRAGRLADARRSIQANLASAAASAADHLLFGDICVAEGKTALAASAYQAARRQGLNDPQLHLKLAHVYFDLGEYLGAVEARTIPDGQPGRIVRGVFVLDAIPAEPGRFLVASDRSAVYHVRQALDAGLDEPGVQLLHADIWLRARRYDEALAIYRQLDGHVAPEDDTRYHQHFAEACLATDDVEGYVTHIEAALTAGGQADPAELASAYLRAAEYAVAAGDAERSIHYLRLAVKRTPQDADLHYRLGSAYHDAARPADASRHWRITLELQPDHPNRQRMLQFIRDNAGTR